MAQAMAAGAKSAAVGADLTARERKLLELMARGLANHQISATLAIAVPTVKFHVTNILTKLQVENRTAAVLVALRHKLVELE
jgi:NarL family two-component system response regulator LiaR